MPTLTIYAGINGAGKSTLYEFQRVMLKPGDLGVRVCPDDILTAFNGNWQEYSDINKSGRKALLLLKDCLEKKQTFNWEFTLITPFVIKQIKTAKLLGYTVNLNFIGVEKVEQSLERIDYRVSRGGHGIAKERVKLRFERQFDNIGEALGLVDNAIFYDNSVSMTIVATKVNGLLKVYSTDVTWPTKLKEHYNLYRQTLLAPPKNMGK